MKNRGILFSILFIICLGLFVTANTRRLISEETGRPPSPEAYKSSMLPEFKSETGTAAGMADAGGGAASGQIQGRMRSADVPTASEPVATVPEEAPVAYGVQIPAEAAAAADLAEKALETVAAAGSQKSQASSVLISPLTGSKETAEGEASAHFGSSDYEKKLKELDAQLKKMKESEVDPNTDSYKNMAEYEYRLWDGELNRIYQGILKYMTTEEAEALRAEEREWIKKRDAGAYKAISKYNGGTIESLEYAASLAASSRERAYELLENYGAYLDAGETADSN